MSVEKYETDTRDIVAYFVGGRISFVDCVHGLDAALTRIVPDLTPEQLPRLQSAVLANRQRVLAAMARQTRKDGDGATHVLSNRQGSAQAGSDSRPPRTMSAAQSSGPGSR